MFTLVTPRGYALCVGDTEGAQGVQSCPLGSTALVGACGSIYIYHSTAALTYLSREVAVLLALPGHTAESCSGMAPRARSGRLCPLVGILVLDFLTRRAGNLRYTRAVTNQANRTAVAARQRPGYETSGIFLYPAPDRGSIPRPAQYGICFCLMLYIEYTSDSTFVIAICIFLYSSQYNT